MTVTASTARWLQKVSDPHGVLMLLELNHTSFATPIRMVSDTRNLAALGHDWLGVPFQIKLPDDKARQTPRAALQMDNVGREIGAELEALPPGASLKAVIRMVHRSTPDVVDYSFSAPMNGVKVDGPTVTATVGRDDIMRISAVRLRFDPSTAPAIFTE
ncbi:MAG: DUF1833 family protein [Pseudomonadota bacterium]